jgi:hypothetical protein
MTPRVSAVPPCAHLGWSGRPWSRPTLGRVRRRSLAWSTTATAKLSLGVPGPWETTGWPVTPSPQPPLGSTSLPPLPPPLASRSVRSLLITLRTRAICRCACSQGHRMPSSRPPCVRARARLEPNRPCSGGGWCRSCGATGPIPPSASAARGLWPPPQSSTCSPPTAGPLVSLALLARPSCSAKRRPPSRRRGLSSPSGSRSPGPRARRLPPGAGLLTRAPRPHRLGHTRGVWYARPRACVPVRPHAWA